MSHYYCTSCFTERIAKALLSKLVGLQDGLSSERTYVLQTMPGGCLRGFCETLTCQDLSGLMRTGAVVVGLALTAAGFVKGSLSIGLRRRVEQQRSIS